jgi:nucleoid-associated protein YgaU
LIWEELASYFKGLLSCVVLLLLGIGARWAFLSPSDLAQNEADLITYKFKPQAQFGGAHFEESLTKAEMMSKRKLLEDLEASLEETMASASVAEKVVEKGSKPEKRTKVFAASRVIQVQTTDHTRYEVEKGDLLGKISKKFYGTHQRYKEILAANPGLNPKALRPGMIIKIPHQPKGLPVNSVAYVQEPKLKHRMYTIKKGDTLGEISQRELGSFKHLHKIMELNPGLSPSRLRLGQKIKLPERVRASH